ncbi:3-ketoacyl-ACP reductase [Cytophagaceae bacterium DM2B3-1]|uniref:3-ketoacyl-ACP reductase n=1 Tax=Xanthocytophaga flava TaxID=3048013 RepID=A0AAE3QM42_9BACT|nr:3-ketoacyl-ACP reductase [Xanthocytophaga flavus]MDJ1467918.1 3-ketoacyl-ACP reductase [Xanthocytophaga flavus]MDJ1479590.1 3-ketoacyl-ACP reductase [Xanthocytophaga flavus]MDJ1497045.1 3-ketoacyl-ACP reductase [Xanthocytophaga flavus]
MESLKGKTALITGAGKGLGRAVALALAHEGVNLALLARTESDLQEVALKAAHVDSSIKIATTTADVSDYAAISAAITRLKEEVGSIDILINNAGVGKFGKFMDLDVDQWENIIKVNLLGAYYAIRNVLPEMQQRQSGDIVNISSTAGQRGAAQTSAYSASKFGLIGLSESLMQEVRKSNIRVFTMTPSTIATDMAMSLNLTDGNPEKVLQPEDFAELLVAHLKLNRRALVKDVGLWSTNP